MDIKKEILKLIKEDFEFRYEMKYLLEISELEDDINLIKNKMDEIYKL